MAGLVSQCAGRGSARWRALSGTGRALALDDVRSRHREPRAGIRAGSACRVAMDEAGVGPGAAAFRKADEGRMHRGHEMWLATLKWVAEGR